MMLCYQESDLKHFPFEVKSKNNKPVIEVQYKNETKQFNPEENFIHGSNKDERDGNILERK